MPITIFAKSIIVDVQLGSKCCSDNAAYNVKEE